MLLDNLAEKKKQKTTISKQEISEEVKKMSQVIQCNKCKKVISENQEYYKLSVNKGGGGGMLSNFSLMPQKSKHLCVSCNNKLNGWLN
jgi:NAD kinase|tara:strand:- start:1417 stop:1680 length:264 start_codon:yes stop_codon:yes gene_type:complete